MSDLSITSYVENFQTVYPKAKVAVRPSRKGFQVYIDGDRVGEPMTRSELEDAARHFRARHREQPRGQLPSWLTWLASSRAITTS